MAFVANNLTLVDAAGLGTVNTFSVYKYTTNDTVSTAAASGYFNSAYKKFHQGDLIILSADVDGTPASNVLIVSSATAATTVTTSSLSTVTQTFNNKYALVVTLAAIGTAEDQYVVVPRAGTITKIDGVSNAAGGGGVSAVITVSKSGGADVGTVTFVSGYSAGGTVAQDLAPVAVAFSAGDVVKVSTNGGGTGAGTGRITLEFSPS